MAPRAGARSAAVGRSELDPLRIQDEWLPEVWRVVRGTGCDRLGLTLMDDHCQTTSTILKFTFLPFSLSVPSDLRVKVSSRACIVFSLITIWPGWARPSSLAAVLTVSP